MCNSQLTKVFNPCNQLLKDSASFFLSESCFGGYEFKQLTVTAILHYQIELGLRLYDFIELNDMRMSHYLENMYLSGDSLYIINVLDFFLLKYFNRNLCNLMVI
jgi:hypothetical protein